METLIKRKSRWEEQNLQRLYVLIGGTEKLTKKIWERSVQTSLFVLFLVYGLLWLSQRLLFLMIERPTLKKTIAPGQVEEIQSASSEQFPPTWLR